MNGARSIERAPLVCSGCDPAFRMSFMDIHHVMNVNSKKACKR